MYDVRVISDIGCFLDVGYQICDVIVMTYVGVMNLCWIKEEGYVKEGLDERC